MHQKLKKEIESKLAFAILGALVSVLIMGIFFFDRILREVSQNVILPITNNFEPSKISLSDFKPFQSAEEFKAYIEESQAGYAVNFGMALGGLSRQDMPVFAESASMDNGKGTAPSAAPIPDRVSETNVQVLGVDEPDIVKTDSQQIYYSNEQPYIYWRGGDVGGGVTMEKSIMMPQQMGDTKVITAMPVNSLAIKSKIDKTGNLLLSDNILVILSGNIIYGYDISNKANPKEKWRIDLEDNTYLAASRLYQNKLYLITSNYLQTYQPCPLKPFSVNGSNVTIACNQIYHPTINVPTDTTFTVAKVNLASGDFEKTVSFVGSSQNSLIYVSPNAIYASYSYYGDFVKFTYSFLKDEVSDLAPSAVLSKLSKLMDYDISDSAKMTELEVILSSWQNSLSSDDRLKLENELTNRMDDYADLHKRDLEKTSIVKINLTNLDFMALGSVPGAPLNQFSLDEYQGHLRIATTVGGSFSRFGQVGQTVSDVYILDKDLKQTGSVLDLGLGERIYSVRFLSDMGYVVTFKQTDPFYVLNLSNPEKPALKGELKIPGYSSYLHPLAENRILGVGKEGSQVKLSIFNVADPANPKEVAKYTLSEYWSDVLNTHHAFLQDEEHQVFFMPGSQGGYIFSYDGDNLKLEKAVSNISAERAVYINDYFYIIGRDKVVVLDENNWQELNDLDL